MARLLGFSRKTRITMRYASIDSLVRAQEPSSPSSRREKRELAELSVLFSLVVTSGPISRKSLFSRRVAEGTTRRFRLRTLKSFSIRKDRNWLDRSCPRCPGLDVVPLRRMTDRMPIVNWEKFTECD